MKYTGLLFIIIFISIQAASQKTVVRGRVMDHEEKALAGATIALGNQRGISDSLGEFTISINPGRAMLHVSMTGFDAFHNTISIGDSAHYLEVRLQPSSSSLNEVVISGTTKPVQRSKSPISVEVYTPQFFKKNPAPSVFESLQNVNGVRPQLNCSVCNTGDIHINGLEGPYTMVTIDGMPIVSSLSSVYGLFGIPSQMIDRVEIIKGPASGIYGSEAIGGLINIITKNPSRVPRFSANLMTTSWLEHNADLGLRWKLSKNISALTGVNYFNYQKPFDKNKDGFTDVTLQNRVSVFNKWEMQRKQDRHFTLAARYFYEDRWGGEMNWNKQFRGGDSVYGESIYTSRYELIGAYQLPLKENILFSTSATWHDQDSWYGKIPYMAKQKIIFNQLKWDKQISADHAMVTGIASRYNYYDDNSTATVDTLTRRNQPEKNFIPGLFVQDEWSINEKHLMLLGLRLDHHPIHKTIFTPRIAYKWSISNNQTFRINSGTGFRVVNLFTEEHAALTGSREVVIIDELRPEQSYNVNLNYIFKSLTPSFGFTLDGSAWYTYFKNQIIADYDTDPNKIIYDNLKGYSISKGITLNMEFNVKQRLKGMAGITILDVKKIEDDYTGKKIKTRPKLTESWSGTWSASYTFPIAGLTLDYTGNIYGPMMLPRISASDPRKAESPVWSIQNFQVTKWISKEIEIYGGVKNLLNWTPAKNNPFLIARSQDPFDKYVQYHPDGSIKPETDPSKGLAYNPYGLSFDPGYIYAPNQGLRLFMGMRLNIK